LEYASFTCNIFPSDPIGDAICAELLKVCVELLDVVLKG